MKKKLLTLAFGLLLAVGWTSSVFAQDSTYTVAQAKTWTYDWVEGNTTHTGVDPTLKVTNPTQMYYLLRHIYMDKRFPVVGASPATPSAIPRAVLVTSPSVAPTTML